jgi:ATP-dependent DNA ligase
MPTKPVRKNGRLIGYKWGNSGKLYTVSKYGKRAKEHADRQASAIYASGYKNFGFNVVVKKRRRDGVKQRYHIRVARPKFAKEIKKDKVIVEPKYDGTRSLFIKESGNLNIINRRDVVKNDIYPEFQDAKSAIDGDAVLDGEVVVIDTEHPFGNFEKLARRDRLKDPKLIKKRTKTLPLNFMAFDILKKNGQDLTNTPLIDRKKILDNTIRPNKFIKEIEFSNNPDIILEKVKKAKGEGIVMKDINSTYEQGPTRKWQKYKFAKINDVAIVGSTPGTGKRTDSFGALQMAVNTPKGFKTVGNVGSGFKEVDLKDIKDKLAKGEKLVARVQYRKLGSKGNYIEPRYISLRTDILQRDTHE